MERLLQITNSLLDFDGYDYWIVKDSNNIKENCFDFSYDEKTTINDLIDFVCKKTNMSACSSIDSDDKSDLIILHNSLMISFVDLSLLVVDVLEKLSLGNKIETFMFGPFGRGEVLRSEAKKKGFKITIRSHEGTKHHGPHVHVEHNSGRTGTIDILTGEMYEGSLRRKHLKIAQQIIYDNKKELMKYWNSHTDGIQYDCSIAVGTSEMFNEEDI